MARRKGLNYPSVLVTGSTYTGGLAEMLGHSPETGPTEAEWRPLSWLSWFLDNHTTEELIPLGVWKKAKWILADFADGHADDGIAAMQAAYKLDGPDAAVGVLGALLVADLPEGTPVPELPDTWNAQQRFRFQEYRDPATRPRLWGVKTSDR